MKLVTAAVTALGLLTMPVAATAGPKGCPPGLAKKHNGCLPPGQAKKMHRDDHRGDREHRDDHRADRRDRDDHRDTARDDRHERDHDYRRGEIFRGDHRIIRDYDHYGLKHPGDRSAYWQAGERIYRVDPQTQQILDIIRLADLVLN